MYLGQPCSPRDENVSRTRWQRPRSVRLKSEPLHVCSDCFLLPKPPVCMRMRRLGTSLSSCAAGAACSLMLISPPCIGSISPPCLPRFASHHGARHTRAGAARLFAAPSSSAQLRCSTHSHLMLSSCDSLYLPERHKSSITAGGIVENISGAAS